MQTNICLKSINLLTSGKVLFLLLFCFLFLFSDVQIPGKSLQMWLARPTWQHSTEKQTSICVCWSISETQSLMLYFKTWLSAVEGGSSRRNKYQVLQDSLGHALRNGKSNIETVLENDTGCFSRTHQLLAIKSLFWQLLLLWILLSPRVLVYIFPHRFPHHWAGVQKVHNGFTTSCSSCFTGRSIVSLQKKEELGF